MIYRTPCLSEEIKDRFALLALNCGLTESSSPHIREGYRPFFFINLGNDFVFCDIAPNTYGFVNLYNGIVVVKSKLIKSISNQKMIKILKDKV